MRYSTHTSVKEKVCSPIFCFFFFNDTATTEIYTLSLHDALPILAVVGLRALQVVDHEISAVRLDHSLEALQDRKSTRLNSSHDQISYAVFCLKKKKQRIRTLRARCTSVSPASYLRHRPLYRRPSS